MNGAAPATPGDEAPLWAVPVRLALLATVLGWLTLRCRLRVWGRLPRRRGPTLVLANHVHDLEAVALPAVLYRRGPWRPPVWSLASERLFEPGFLPGRTPPALRPLVGPRLMGWLLRVAGALPLENEPRHRALSSLAWEVAGRHGDLPLGDVFDDETAADLTRRGGVGSRELHLRHTWSATLAPQAERPVALRALRQPYRREVEAATRGRIAAQMERAACRLRRGGTLVLFPEGHISRDGRLGRLRGALGALLAAEDDATRGEEAVPAERRAAGAHWTAGPGAVRVAAAAVSLDPLAPGRRLPVLIRLVPLPAGIGGREGAGGAAAVGLADRLRAARPVTAAQALCAWLAPRLDGPPFGAAEAVDGAVALLAALPATAFLTPGLGSDPGRCVRTCLAALRRGGRLVDRAGRLADRGGGLRVAALPWRDARLPLVADLLAHQANTFAETRDALERAQRPVRP